MSRAEENREHRIRAEESRGEEKRAVEVRGEQRIVEQRRAHARRREERRAEEGTGEQKKTEESRSASPCIPFEVQRIMLERVPHQSRSLNLPESREFVISTGTASLPKLLQGVVAQIHLFLKEITCGWLICYLGSSSAAPCQLMGSSPASQPASQTVRQPSQPRIF